MVRIRGPLHSLKASKQFGHLMIFKTYGNRNILTKYNAPGSVKPFTKSATQSQQRTIYGQGVEAWQALSDSIKEQYNETAKGEQYSGYNLFMQEYITAHEITDDLSYYGKRIYGIFIYGKT